VVLKEIQRNQINKSFVQLKEMTEEAINKLTEYFGEPRFNQALKFNTKDMKATLSNGLDVQIFSIQFANTNDIKDFMSTVIASCPIITTCMILFQNTQDAELISQHW
jgi:hypothetical protein